MRGSRGLGATGERLALEHLRAKGYELVESNWSCSSGELDLIVRDGPVLVFVEVRTRRGVRAGSPEESVTAAKQARLVALAERWLHEHCGDTEPPECRIDVVGVHLSAEGRLLGLNHLVGAVQG
ncbi:MAG: YraN family protein [Chloroflexota bacterium]|nr:YraN family protein [Chloroflexota bacterium]